MTGVAELLAAAGGSAPVQRVRNYHLTDRAASPRPRDFLTAAKRTDGAVCLRWDDPTGDCFVRFADGKWERAEYDRLRNRKTVETLDADRLRSQIRDASPELVASTELRGAFDRPSAVSSPVESGEGVAVATDGGAVADRVVEDGAIPDLSVAPNEVAFRLPLALAEETVLEPVAGSDRLFVAELVPERETERAYYVRQGRRGCLVPKAEATVYERPESETGNANVPETSGSE